MKKKQFPIGFTEKQKEYLELISGCEGIAAYVRKLVDEDMAKNDKR